MSMTRFFVWVCLQLGMLSIAHQAIAQKAPKPATFKEGQIDYELKFSGASFEQAEQFLKNTTLSFLVKGEHMRMELVGFAGLAKIQLIQNASTKIATLLLDIPTFADKIAVNIPNDFAENPDLGLPPAMSGMDAEKVKDGLRMIAQMLEFKGKDKVAKHKCKIANLKIPTGDDTKISFLLTDKIRLGSVNVLESFDILGGFPLGMSLSSQGNAIDIMATKVQKNKIEDTKFAIPKGYEQKTLKEFQEMIEGFTGSGNGIMGM